MSSTEVLYLNHSSVLIKYQGNYLLCDPWYERPAFGSWLPTFPLVVHPVYLASLKDKLTILISHGHDDHCDDELLLLFDKDTPIISSDFASPSVKNRLSKLGFLNYSAADHDGVSTGPFYIKSIRNDEISEDDATYLIRTPDALTIHCNDNWFEMKDWQKEIIKTHAGDLESENILLMSQTNSASGFPLNYTNYSHDEKAQLLKDKVRKMIGTGLKNAESVGAKYFHSYAGYASVFVSGKPEYLNDSIFPTPRCIKSHFADLIPDGVEVLDFYPGDTFDFQTQSVHKSFFDSDLSDDDIKDTSTTFYSLYGQKMRCDSFGSETIPDAELIERKLIFFLENFDRFVERKSQQRGYYASINGKKLRIHIPDLGLSKTLKFGEGIVDEVGFNKEIIVSPLVMSKVLDGKILFENLYTGYNAEFSREPANEYNRDIIMYIVMFSYLYKNRLASTFKQAEQYHEV